MKLWKRIINNFLSIYWKKNSYGYILQISTFDHSDFILEETSLKEIKELGQELINFANSKPYKK